jgi:deazaflavin-dependent oxidoreductase (nitroreductase family)
MRCQIHECTQAGPVVGNCSMRRGRGFTRPPGQSFGISFHPRRRRGRADYRYAAVHHIGRKSGRAYIRPVAAEPIIGGFVTTLPYGVNTDWCRNVLAAGEATLDVRGEAVNVVHPRVVDLASIEDQVQTELVRSWKRLRIRQYLRVDRARAVRRVASAIPDPGIEARLESVVAAPAAPTARTSTIPGGGHL